jgi:hypothetical protein
MKIPPTLLGIVVVATLQAPMFSQSLGETGNSSDLKVVLLGTAGGPTFSAQRLGIATLVQAGPENLLFDCGLIAGVQLLLEKGNCGSRGS